MTDQTTGDDKRSTLRSVLVRAAIALVAIGIAGFVLFNLYQDLDLGEIRKAIQALAPGEIIALGVLWTVWIFAQGFMTASLVGGLSIVRGTQAFVGPTAVASVIPGPSDLPVRYSMYRSWGVSNEEAVTAVAASGIFSIGSQLLLPVLAGIGVVGGNVPIEGFGSIIVVCAVVLAGSAALIVFAVGSPRRTAKLGHLIDKTWGWVLRVLRRPERRVGLDELLVSYRATAIGHLEGKWVRTSIATGLAIAAKYVILVASLRFVGVPAEAISWAAIFVVFALVAGLTTLPITPGSAGVAELALVAMLTPIAGSSFVNEVAAGVLLYRILTWILVIPAGLLVLLGWGATRRRNGSVLPA